MATWSFENFKEIRCVSLKWLEKINDAGLVGRCQYYQQTKCTTWQVDNKDETEEYFGLFIGPDLFLLLQVTLKRVSLKVNTVA